MAQLVRKAFRKPEQIKEMSRDEQLALSERMRLFRENARKELATNLTLTDGQKIDHIVDYIVGVPLE